METAVEKPPAVILPQPTTPDASRLSGLALSSLILSFFSVLVPIGIAAVVLGHVSRSQIAKSEGRLRGTGVAFAGLIISYLQLTLLFVVLVAVGITVWHEASQDFERRPYLRAALVERMKNGPPKDPPPDNPAENQKNAVAALEMIRARQSEYLASHPDQGYACRLEQIGEPLNPENELGGRITKSHYYMEIERCATMTNKLWYTVLASPRTDWFSSPTYCLDMNGVIYKYRPDQQHDVIMRLVAVDPELCPEYGDRVEPAADDDLH